MESITLIPAAVIIALVALIGVVAIVFARKLEAAQWPEGVEVKPHPAKLAPGIALIAVSVIAAAWLGATVAIAYDHGMYDTSVPIMQMAYANEHSFPDQSDQWQGSSSMAGKVIIMYRYTCEDCEATSHAIEAALAADGIEHLWISSRSEKGFDIRNRYNVNEVPYYIAFSPNGSVLTKSAFRTNEKDEPEMDKAAYEEVRAFVKGDGHV